MAELNLFLPPCSSDFSGVLSVLFELGGLLIVHDAACCTRNYVDHEEPRWSREKNATFCSQLRTIDAVLGSDEKLVGQACEAAEELHPPFIAVLGTPVPSLIGTDMEGIAHEIEARTGIPSMGFSTCGFRSYESGIRLAMDTLIARLARPPEKKPASRSKPLRLNLLGLTPLDFYANGNAEELRTFFEAQGFDVTCSLAMGYRPEDVAGMLSADVSLAMTSAAAHTAETLFRQYGIPYAAGTPLGAAFSRTLAADLRQAACTGQPVLSAGQPEPAKPGKDRLLILWEETMAASLRAALLQRGCRAEIVTASLQKEGFPALRGPGHLTLRGERELLELLEKEHFSRILADPLILGLPLLPETTQKTGIVHPALSSRLFEKQEVRFLSPEFEALLDSAL